jgi:membrane associated rhomboid family serine protease
MFRNLTTVVRWLLYANTAVFLLQQVWPLQLEEYFALWPVGAHQRYGTPDFGLWQLLSYGFLHGGIGHIFMNMFALCMFGPTLERLLGPRRFLNYYLVCVAGAAIAQQLVQFYLTHDSAPTLGASGGVFGLLLLFGMAYPHQKLMWIFPPIVMPAWVFVTLYGLAELLMGVFNVMPGVAHFAHIGGMLAGFLLIRYWHAVRMARDSERR